MRKLCNLLTLLLARDEVLEEVDGECVAWRQVGLAVDHEEPVDLCLRAELRSEGASRDFDFGGVLGHLHLSVELIIDRAAVGVEVLATGTRYQSFRG